MALTYDYITSTTTTSNATSVVFNPLNTNYTDLIIVCNAGASTTQDLWMRFNGDTTNNYLSGWLYGTGSVAGTVKQQTTYIICNWYGSLPTGSTSRSAHIINIANYNNSTTFKTALMRAGLASSGVDLGAGHWKSTNPITSITLIPSSGNFTDGSTFTMYGIKAA